MEELKKEEFIYCQKCGAKNSKGANICQKCGCQINKNSFILKCPKCGSTDIELKTIPEKRQFNKGMCCLGALALGPLGTLCGIGSKSKAITIKKCKNCGNEF